MIASLFTILSKFFFDTLLLDAVNVEQSFADSNGRNPCQDSQVACKTEAYEWVRGREETKFKKAKAYLLGEGIRFHQRKLAEEYNQGVPQRNVRSDSSEKRPLWRPRSQEYKAMSVVPFPSSHVRPWGELNWTLKANLKVWPRQNNESSTSVNFVVFDKTNVHSSHNCERFSELVIGNELFFELLLFPLMLEVIMGHILFPDLLLSRVVLVTFHFSCALCWRSFVTRQETNRYFDELSSTCTENLSVIPEKIPWKKRVFCGRSKRLGTSAKGGTENISLSITIYERRYSVSSDTWGQDTWKITAAVHQWLAHNSKGRSWTNVFFVEHGEEGNSR